MLSCLFAVLVRRARDKVPEVKVTFFVNDSKLKTTGTPYIYTGIGLILASRMQRQEAQSCGRKAFR
jgi:hypothetical protein